MFPHFMKPGSDGNSITVRDMAPAWFSFMGLSQQRDGPPIVESMREMGRLPADEAWVYRCITIKAQAAQTVPLRVEVKDGIDWIDNAVASNGAANDLQWLLDDVNPVNLSGATLKAWIQAGRDVWGESYVQKVRGRRGGAPQELYYLRAPDITPNMGRTWIDSYTYRPKGVQQPPIPVDDVIAFRRINLQDPTRGLSPLSAVRTEVAVLRQVVLAEASTLANSSVPPGAWVVPKGEELNQQDQNLIRRVLRQFRGPRNAGKVPIMPAGLEWKSLALTPKDAEWVASRKLSRMAVCSAFGVPLVMAGDDERTTVYHNMRDAERIFWRMSMISELDDVADTLNSWLVPDFDPGRRMRPARPTLRVRFVYTNIEALQDPLVQRQQVALNELDRGARLINEYRAEFGIGGGKAVGWGDLPYLSTSISPVPIGPGEADGEVAPPAITPDNEIDPAQAVRGFRDLYRNPTVKAWLASPTRPLDMSSWLGSPTSDDVRRILETGLRRRYSPDQLADGVPAEGYPGLRGIHT